MRKIYWSLLLPFFLLFAQQGALRHEIGHLGNPPGSSQKQVPTGVDHCDLCLAYGHLAGAAETAVPVDSLLSDLAFHFAPEDRFSSAEAVSPAPRSRGPPHLLLNS